MEAGGWAGLVLGGPGVSKSEGGAGRTQVRLSMFLSGRTQV